MPLSTNNVTVYKMVNRPSSPRSQLEQEKKIRREIANSNERRRMQSINAGFNSLRTMLPKHDGEKLSKAAILQHTAEYIYQLEQDKTKLLQEICQLKKMLAQDFETADESVSPTKKIKVEKVKEESSHNSDSSDEGIQCYSTREMQCDSDSTNDEIRTELIEVRKILDRERRLRMQLEDQVRGLEAQLYPERIKEIANQVQLQFQSRSDGEPILPQVDETSAAVSSVVSDEIVAETIEIETHSCPESPTMQPTIVIQAPSSNTSSTTTFNIDAPQDLTSKSAKNSSSKSSSKSPQPAAIALPIDVPFIESDSQNSEGQSTVTVQIIGLSAEAVTAANSTSRQNLDTIVEAIRHLEGDHLFRDEDESAKSVNKVNAEMIVDSENDKNVKTVTMSSEQLGAAIRKQVIQSLPMQSRPGVIVANRA